MSKKRILFFAHYYSPDTASTGQLLKDQAEGMLKEFDVTVVCTVPSYGGKIAPEYKKRKYYFETINGVKIIRVRVPEFTKTSKISRVKNILSYFFGAMGAALKSGKQDYIFTISQPPILGGLLGVFGKWSKRAKLIYCIQDFNPEQIMAVKYISNGLVLRSMMMADQFSCRHSNLVITVGRDLADTLKKRFQNKHIPRFAVINNWINEKEVYPLPPDNQNIIQFKQKYGLQNKFVIMYSGNIGLYYDLENIIQVLKRFRKGYASDGTYETGPITAGGREVVFAFVGNGAVLHHLMEYVKEHRFENITFIPYQKKSNLIYSLNSGDVHWCVNAKGIKGVSCPSKVYGIMGAGKPVIGVLETGSEVRTIIDDCGCGKCCEPGEYDTIAEIIHWYITNSEKRVVAEMGINGRKYLEKHFTKDVSIQKYIDQIKAL